VTAVPGVPAPGDEASSSELCLAVAASSEVRDAVAGVPEVGEAVAASPELRDAVAAVPDPEIPALGIADLGILREVRTRGERVEVDITPTYSGCPAMEAIRADIVATLRRRGVADIEVRTVLSPPWSTDSISEAGRRKLLDLGIAPPGPVSRLVPEHGEWRPGLSLLPLRNLVACPHCGSSDTDEVSRFSSTACKSLHRCRSCGEPFEHFKAH